MTLSGIEFPPWAPLPLHPDFLPLAKWREGFLRTARHPFHVAVERPDGVAVHHTFVHGEAALLDADVYHVRQAVKALLWGAGGFRVCLSGNEAVCRAAAACFVPGGPCAFDADFMQSIYHRTFSVVRVDRVPEARSVFRATGGHIGGCRIGFDAGGSDRKAVALWDGKPVYSEEVPWSPKTAVDLTYHYKGILAGLRAAAAHLPRVDAVGISTAGICQGDRLLRSALFEAVPHAAFDPNIYRRAANDAFGPVPFAVINDGDAAALAGATLLGKTGLLGLALGTSLAAGYVDDDGQISGWLNELAFVPIDAHPAAPADLWSGGRGCGGSYLSQDGIIRLARAADIRVDEQLTPAEKLTAIQRLAEGADSRALAVFDTVGAYLAHALALYAQLYPPGHVLLQGRVTSGRGGERILGRCQAILAAEYPDLSAAVTLHLPGERLRRTGQAAAAAALPDIP